MLFDSSQRLYNFSVGMIADAINKCHESSMLDDGEVLIVEGSDPITTLHKASKLHKVSDQWDLGQLMFILPI